MICAVEVAVVHFLPEEMKIFHTILRQNLFQSAVSQQVLVVRGCIKKHFVDALIVHRCY